MIGGSLNIGVQVIKKAVTETKRVKKRVTSGCFSADNNSRCTNKIRLKFTLDQTFLPVIGFLLPEEEEVEASIELRA